MAENYVQLEFKTLELINIPNGSYCTINGERFTKLRSYEPTQDDKDGYSYSVQFDDVDGWLRKFNIFYRGQDFLEASFAKTGTLDGFCDIIVSCINAELGTTDWERGQIDDTTTFKTISFKGEKLFDACTLIAQEYGLEWWISKNNGKIQLNFGKLELGNNVDFVEGEIISNMIKMEGDSSNYGTRFYVFGSTRNLPKSYGEVSAGSVINEIAEVRLRLPNGQNYIDAIPNLSKEDRVDKVVFLEDEYPKNTDVITKVETKQVTENGVTRTIYTIYADKTPFVPEDIVTGETLKCVFQTGQLMFQEFELSIDKDNFKRGFEIVLQENDGIFTPNPQNSPAIGDKFVLTGVRLSEEKIKDAENHLLEVGTAYAEKNSRDTNLYECPTNKVKCTAEKINYELGQIVTLRHTRFGANGRRSRIQGYTKSIYNTGDASYQVGDNPKYSRFGAIEERISEVKYSTRIGVSYSNINIIKSTDYSNPTDDNVYSALKAKLLFDEKAKLQGDINQHFGASFLRLKIQKKDTKFNVPESEIGFYFTEDGQGSETPIGGNGVSSYVDLQDKPQVNGIELKSGNNSLAELGITSAISDYVSSEKGIANGLAGLGADGKVLSSQLPDFLLGQLLYGGDINASSVATLSATFKDRYKITSNTLTITSALASTYNNVYFICSANGKSGIVKTLNCAIGDWVISNGISWNKIDNTDAVSSVAGLVGTITSNALVTAIADEIKKVKVNNAVNADKLNSKDANYYLTNNLTFQNQSMINGKFDATECLANGGMITNYASPSWWLNAPSGMGYGSVLMLKSTYADCISAELAWDIIRNSKTPTKNIWFRAKNNLGFKNDWVKIWHSRNSNLLTVAWKAQYLQFPILTTAPTITEGVALYFSEEGTGAETPTGGGVSSYVDLTDKPKINGIELKSGNNTLAELGIAPINHTHTIAQITSLQTTLDSKVKQVKIGTTAYNPASGIVTLPAYPTSLPASDVSAWAKQPNKPTYTTTEVAEGANKYFTEERAKAVKVNNAINSDKLGNQLPSFYAKASDLNKYLPLAGGEMTGTITANMSSNFRGIRLNCDITEGGWDRQLGTVYNAEGTNLCKVGFYGVGQTLNRFYVGKSYSGTDAWLAIGRDLFTYKNYTIYHAGNSNSLTINWSAKKLKSKTLVIPTTEPTDLISDEIGLYFNESGTGGETPALPEEWLYNYYTKSEIDSKIQIINIKVTSYTNRIADLEERVTALENK